MGTVVPATMRPPCRRHEPAGLQDAASHSLARPFDVRHRCHILWPGAVNSSAFGVLIDRQRL